MNRNILPNNQNKPLVFSDMLKVTSLRLLKEALIKEDYEICAALIRDAKEQGVSNAQIKFLLAWHATGPKGAGSNFRRARGFKRSA